MTTKEAKNLEKTVRNLTEEVAKLKQTLKDSKKENKDLTKKMQKYKVQTAALMSEKKSLRETLKKNLESMGYYLNNS
jgi:peptidoglycan hydrolase CwlO-like protein